MTDQAAASIQTLIMLHTRDARCHVMQAGGRVDDLIGLAASCSMASQAVTIRTRCKAIVPTKSGGSSRLTIVTLVGAGLVGWCVDRGAVSRCIPDLVEAAYIRRSCWNTIVIVVATTGSVRIIVTVVTHLLLLDIGAGKSETEFSRQTGHVNLVFTGRIRIRSPLRPVIAAATVTGITTSVYSFTSDKIRSPSGLGKGILTCSPG